MIICALFSFVSCHEVVTKYYNSVETSNVLSGNETYFEREEHVIPISLQFIDSNRTKEYFNFRMPKLILDKILRKENNQKPNNSVFLVGKQNAPIFKFKALSTSVARHVIFSPMNQEFKANVRQIRFVFYYERKIIYRTIIFDLPPKYEEPIIFDLEEDILFDSVDFDIVQNWGDEYKTYLNDIRMYGPSLK